MWANSPAEGLCASTLLDDLPCWAALGGRLDQILIPDRVKRLLIVEDNDPAGQLAAARVVGRAVREGLTIERCPPRRCFGDGTDMLDAHLAASRPARPGRRRADEDSTKEQKENIIDHGLESARMDIMEEDLQARGGTGSQTLIYGARSGLPSTVPPASGPAARSQATPHPAPPANASCARMPAKAFGAWLLLQDSRSDWIGDLARAAKADRSFPKAGDPETVRLRLSALGAEADMFEALDASEIEWLCF